MRKTLFVAPAMIALALAISGCAKHGEDNAAATNDAAVSDLNEADSNLSASDTENDGDTVNLNESPTNAL